MRIVIVDDDVFVSGALKTILETDQEIEVAGVGADGKDAVMLYEREKPDVVLMDIRMKEMGGLEASRKILAADPEARILLLTTFSDDEYIVKALKYGVKGYLLKQDYGSIIPALKAVCLGQSVFGTGITARLPGLLNERKPFDFQGYGLSGKEYEVVTLVAEGLSNKEIAAEMFLSEGTVRNYISGILEKLSLRDRTQLAVFYLTGRTG